MDMSSLNTRPRYRFCWWCSLQLRGNFHRVMESGDHAANGNVLVHVSCGDEMLAEGWEDTNEKREHAA
jgi:hypothetical protein